MGLHVAVCDACWGEEAPVAQICNTNLCEGCVEKILDDFRQKPSKGDGMKVKDLINILQKMPKDDDVRLFSGVDAGTGQLVYDELSVVQCIDEEVVITATFREHNLDHLRLPPLARYVATTANGSRITSTLARTEAEASSELFRQLQKSGREGPLSSWANGGHSIMKEDLP
jgi:hypothetical protein